MVLKRRLDYGFDGFFHIPVVPRAPRSIRRRGPRKIDVEDRQICAFELLAAVAGLLQENGSSASSNASEAKDLLGIHSKCIKEETVEEGNKGSRTERLDHGSCKESVFVPELESMAHNNIPISGDIDSLLEQHLTNMTNFDSSKKVVDCELKLGLCNSNPTIDIDTEVGASGYHVNQSTDLTMANDTCCAKKQAEEKKCLNSELINPDSNVQLSLYRDHLPLSASFPEHRSDVNLGIVRDDDDDDENSFRCNKLSTKIMAFRPQPRNSFGRFRKKVASKYWKVGPEFRDLDLPNTDEGVKTHYFSRKRIHTVDRCIKEAPFKKRLLYNHSFESILCDTFEKHSSSSSIHGENGVSGAVKAQKKQKDSKVKLSIKSFKVPELFIEVPETATIGSLKRTVMETVTAILGGGLRVGLVLQGEKVRDDSRTLQQAGIYSSSNLDTLAFILEPSFPPVLETCKDSIHLSKSVEEPKLQRSPMPNVRFHPPQVTEMDIGNLEIMTSSLAHADALTDETKQDSKPFVLNPAPKAEPFAAVHMNNPKAKRSEFSQRRARRPFSVTEVEALVEAVETLGTGRWREVKMRAFDIANHRTYVDLKDKWKTLVHTASISSQQRRGEPVPQELLDRVLSAHAYWTKYQPKPPGKLNNPEPLKAIDSRSMAVEV